MNTFIQLSAEERSLYCRQRAKRMEIPLHAAVIEKDFWCYWTLNLINENPELNGNITFKGGTSFSKAWGLIEWFSEDIDIAINRKVLVGNGSVVEGSMEDIDWSQEWHHRNIPINNLGLISDYFDGQEIYNSTIPDLYLKAV